MWTPAIPDGPLPVHRKILAELERDIRAGRLAAGCQLPPQRELALLLGVSVGTVTRVYNEARERGLVEGTVGRGTFVAEQTGAATAGPLEVSPSHPIDLSHAYVLPDALEPSLRAAFAELGDVTRLTAMLYRYQAAEGAPWHRQLGAQWVGRLGWKPDPSQMVVTVGAQHALFLSLATLTKPGDTVLCERLTFTGVKTAARLLNLQTHGVAMDTEGLIPEALDEAARATGARVAYAIPTCQNPLGVTMTVERRRAIAAVLEARNLTLIEDDVYGFLAPKPMPAIASMAPNSVCFVTSLSKAAAPGLRVGFLAVPPGNAPRFAQSLRATTIQSVPVTAEIGCRWIVDGTAARISASYRDESIARYEMARAAIPQIAPAGLATPSFFWLELGDRWHGDAFTAAARLRGVIVTGAADFQTDRGPAPSAVRVCTGPETRRERLARALEILSELAAQAPSQSLAVT